MKMISKLIEQLNEKNRLCDGIIVLDFPESERIQLLSELEATQWIPVSEILPDQTKQSEVQFYAKPYEWWSGMYTPKGHCGFKEGVFQYHQHWGDDDYHTIENVVAWRYTPDPLPQPKEQK